MKEWGAMKMMIIMETMKCKINKKTINKLKLIWKNLMMMKKLILKNDFNKIKKDKEEVWVI